MGQDLQLRGVHYQDIFSGHAGNNYTSEAVLATGAIDAAVSYTHLDVYKRQDKSSRQVP